MLLYWASDYIYIFISHHEPGNCYAKTNDLFDNFFPLSSHRFMFSFLFAYQIFYADIILIEWMERGNSFRLRITQYISISDFAMESFCEQCYWCYLFFNLCMYEIFWILLNFLAFKFVDSSYIAVPQNKTRHFLVCSFHYYSFISFYMCLCFFIIVVVVNNSIPFRLV